MGSQLSWQSFWDLASPEQGAQKVIELYGAEAVEAAALCAAAASSDNRDEDYRFWMAVLARVTVADRGA